MGDGLSRPPWIVALTTAAVLIADDAYTLRRQRMVEEIKSLGVRNPEVLRVMGATPRHRFVPEALAKMAYEDRALPIGYDATISQPYVVALMTEALELAKQHRVLEIGTGSGYQAAILAQLVRQVYTIEIVPELAKSARETLRQLGYSNITVRQGDGYQGWPEEAPFDRIILTASPPAVPDALVAQLAAGGRLVAPVGSSGHQELVLVEKGADGKIRQRTFGDVIFVPMKRGGNL